MIFRIILTVGGAVTGIGSAIASAIRILIAWGLGRASIATLLTAWAATGPKGIRAEAFLRANKDIAITVRSMRLWPAPNAPFEHLLSFTYKGQADATRFYTCLNSPSAVLDASLQKTLCVQRFFQLTEGQNLINAVRTEKFTVLQNLCASLPAAVAAFFLAAPFPAEAEDCLEEFIEKYYGLADTGFFTERVYGWAECTVGAKRSSSGTWELDPLVIVSKIDIGAPLDNMDSSIYNELLTWLNSLSPAQVLDEIESQGNYNGVNYFQEINNQANVWVNSLNAGL